MARRQHIPLSRSELNFWKAAFLAAQVPMLLKRGTRNLDPTGAAHLAAEYADAAVLELRRAKGAR